MEYVVNKFGCSSVIDCDNSRTHDVTVLDDHGAVGRKCYVLCVPDLELRAGIVIEDYFRGDFLSINKRPVG